MDLIIRSVGGESGIRLLKVLDYSYKLCKNGYMKLTKEQKTKLTEALMNEAFDTADRSSTECWGIDSDSINISCFDNLKDLRKAVKKFVNSIDKLL
jgi:hypothetical protein